MSLEYDKSIVPLVKQLRHNMTDQERHLWYDFLCRYGVRFQRQKTIGGYIVDFYCHKAKLVVELDGGQHYEPEGQAYDAKRDAYLSSLGLCVARFSNTDVNENFYGVCQRIDTLVNARYLR